MKMFMQLNLSTTATLGTEKNDRRREMAVVEKFKQESLYWLSATKSGRCREMAVSGGSTVSQYPLPSDLRAFQVEFTTLVGGLSRPLGTQFTINKVMIYECPLKVIHLKMMYHPDCFHTWHKCQPYIQKLQ